MFKFKLKKREPRRRKRPSQKDDASRSIHARAIWIAAACLVSIWLIVFIAMALSNLGYFKVASVEVWGNEGLDSARPEEFLRIYRGKNIFSVDIKALAGVIARRYPDARSVVARRKLPDTLNITMV